MIEAYKGFAGSYVPVKDGDEKHEATHYIATKEEMEAINSTIKKLKKQLKEKEKENEENIRQMLREQGEKLSDKDLKIWKIEDDVKKLQQQLKDNEQIVERAKREAEWIKEDAREKAGNILYDARDQIEHNQKLADAMKRIHREKANAARGLTPKKKRSGYLILRSEEWMEGKNRVYRTKLQMPYSTKISKEQVEPEFKNDMKKHVGARLGQKEIYHAPTRKCNYEREGVLYNWLFDANYKTGLWEVTIFTTSPIVANEDMIPDGKVF